MPDNKSQAHNVKVKTYTITMVTMPDGSVFERRENNGFSVLELLGELEVVKAHLLSIVAQTSQVQKKTELKSQDSPLMH